MSAISTRDNIQANFGFVNIKDVSGNPVYKQPDEPSKIPFQKAEVRSSGRVPSAVAFLINSLVRNYIFNNKCHLETPISLKLRFSLEKGVEVISKPNEGYSEEFNFIKFLTNSFVKLSSFSAPTSILTIYSKNDSQQSDVKSNEEVLTNDIISSILYSNQIANPVDVDLEVQSLTARRGGMGLTTSYLRYPHLLKDLSIRFPFHATIEDFKIGIIGPGLYEAEEFKPTCPQFVEVYGLFPKASFTLLDVDKKCLSTLTNSLCEEKNAFYDPLTLLIRTRVSKINHFLAPEDYLPVFSQLISGLVENTDNPEENSQIFYGQGDLKALSVNVVPEKISIQEYDALKSTMVTVEGGYNVIVATNSITNAYFGNGKYEFDCSSSFTQILHSLKKDGGVCYMDRLGFDGLQKYMEKYKDGFAPFIAKIEAEFGSEFKFDMIPVSDYFKGEKQDVIASPFFLMTDATLFQRNVSSASLVVITRMK